MSSSCVWGMDLLGKVKRKIVHGGLAAELLLELAGIEQEATEVRGLVLVKKFSVKGRYW